MGVDFALFPRPQHTRPGSPKLVPFTPLTEVQKAVTTAINAVDFEETKRNAAEAAWEWARGRA